MVTSRKDKSGPRWLIIGKGPDQMDEAVVWDGKLPGLMKGIQSCLSRGCNSIVTNISLPMSVSARWTERASVASLWEVLRNREDKLHF